MAKKKSSIYICTNCGNEYSKWSGQCPACDEWNTLEESSVAESVEVVRTSKSIVENKKLRDIELDEIHRVSSGFVEVDRVLGGDGEKMGFVSGEVILLSGEPGVGKSTILLQILANMSSGGKNVAYVSAEESSTQVGIRAKRLLKADFGSIDMDIISGFEVDGIIEKISQSKADFVVIDSIQTVYVDGARGIAGGVSQVKASSMKLVNYAKTSGVTMIIVGHITKEGNIAGPKVLEHLVDAVIQIEGDQKQGYRLLRGLKNRFGATNEVGILAMGEDGLKDMSDASGLFISSDNSVGICRSAIVEGNRVIGVEIQALTTTTPFSQPKRVAQGISSARLQLICAVLQKHAKLKLYDKDVYVNIAGGIRVDDPGVDLAVALAITSSMKGVALGSDFAALGELSLSGNLGNVVRVEQRTKELNGLGYSVKNGKEWKNIKAAVASISK